jgi:hypothetical protein
MNSAHTIDDAIGKQRDNERQYPNNDTNDG